jgi:TonB family protein
MRTILPGSARRSIPLFFALLAGTVAAQTPLESAAIPKDPKALIELATRSNNLSGNDVKPWHLEASFGEVGAGGKVAIQGTFEEIWAGPTRFKRVLTSPEYTIVEYGTTNGVVRVGGAGRDDWALVAFHNAFVDPLPAALDLGSMDIKVESTTIGSDAVRCINLKPKPTAFTAPLFATREYCFEPGSLFLRFGRDDRVTTSAGAHPISFQNHFVPSFVAVQRAPGPTLSAHVETLELVSEVSDVLFTPPQAAEPSTAADQVTLPTQTAESYLTTRVQPVYPPIAKAARIQGTVVLQVLIGTNGQVKQIGVQSGHPMLQQAAIDAVKQWIYKPYLINGKPKSVYTTVNVIFLLEK